MMTMPKKRALISTLAITMMVATPVFAHATTVQPTQTVEVFQPGNLQMATENVQGNGHYASIQLTDHWGHTLELPVWESERNSAIATLSQPVH